MRLARRRNVAQSLEQGRHHQLHAGVFRQAGIETLAEARQIGGSGQHDLSIRQPVRLGRRVLMFSHVLATRTARAQKLHLRAMHEQLRAIRQICPQALRIARLLLERHESEAQFIALT
jgi:hypothetical protein